MTGAEGALAYRDIGIVTEVLSADGLDLVAILYRQLVDALRMAQHPARLHASSIRALALLAEIESAVISDGSVFSQSIAAVHRETRAQTRRGWQQNDPNRFQMAIAAVEPIAEAWASLRPNR